MADDTRLADACLLLNYSSQSYKEQMLLSKKLQQPYPDDEQDFGVRPDLSNPLVGSNVSSKPITPPPEHSELVSNTIEIQTSETSSSNVCENESNQIIESAASDGIQSNDGMKFYDESYYASREPIHNLLAAVNCAMPSLKSRPNILQRYSSNSFAPGSRSNLADHDYCQQVQDCTLIDNNSNSYADRSDASSASNKFNHELNHYHECNLPNKRRQKADQSRGIITEMKKSLKLVAVHLGVGNSTNNHESMQLAKSICEEVMLQMTNQDVTKESKKKRKAHDSLSKQEECCRLNLKENAYSAESAVVQLIKRMEDHQSLNCGYGSNLNMYGQVECDASLMSDRTHMWTGVGALSGCKNPILLAKSLYDHRNVSRPLGLVQPNLLVGSGAKQWMREHCSHLSIMDSKMISQKSFSTYQKLKSRYDMAVKAANQEKISTDIANSSFALFQPTRCSRNKLEANRAKISDFKTHSKSTSLDHGFYCIATKDNLKKAPSFAGTIDRVKSCELDTTDLKDSHLRDMADLSIDKNAQSISEDVVLHYQDYRLDTVGAIAVDEDNNFASAISSGGLLLKYKGRVGQAAVPGAGCWSEDSVAITTTGVGEYLTLNLFARKFYDKMLTLRLLYDLGHVEKKPDLSSLISCGMEECFEDLLKSPALEQVPPRERLAGMLAVSTLNSKNSPKRIDDKDLYLSYAHNTKSMCIGYMTCNDNVGHSVMSLKEGENDGEPLVKTIKFTLDQSNK